MKLFFGGVKMFCSVGEIFYVRGVDRLAGRKINYMKVVEEGRSYRYGYRAGTANRKEIEEMGAGGGLTSQNQR
jgi:hypothetical protein